MIRKSQSLRRRIILLSGVWIIMALVATGAVLLGFYQSHIEQHYDAHVLMHMEEMVAAARLDADGRLDLAYPPSDPRYQVPGSGWYWEILHDGRVLAHSPSLGEATLNPGSFRGAEHGGTRVVDGPNGNPIRLQTMKIPAGIPGEQLELVATAPMMGIRDDVIDVGEHLGVSLSVLGILLILAVYLQVQIALKPIREISEGIGKIHQGTSHRIEGEFPRGLKPLVDELNNLMEHNSVLLRRARNQLGDLAHSIKNPLTVINHEARAMTSERGQLILKQTADITDSVNHHLSRARAFGATNAMGSRAMVRPIAEDLVFAMKRIYKERDLEFDLSGLGDCAVRCEAQDFEEILGNLLDNACKWAKSRVIVHSKSRSGRCFVYVEDDGPGIPEDKVEQVLQRGERLDDSRDGQGLGLSIVQEHMQIYNGSLSLSSSGYGGLSAKLELPGA